MKRILKSIPLILVILYAGLSLINDWKNMNGIKIFAFSFSIIFLSYLVFMILTVKYIDFKNGFKLKHFPNQKNVESTNNTADYLKNTLFIFGIILLAIYLYNSFFLNVQLTYLLYILIGIAFLSFVLRRNKK
ncbi:hypothetical protein [Tenacibaculum insulae]|uniref:hypothetical protein n=1 Tax=Tenacibaculum insulae TaxID=2029677 RepID=UPI003AB707A2